VNGHGYPEVTLTRLRLEVEDVIKCINQTRIPAVVTRYGRPLAIICPATDFLESAEFLVDNPNLLTSEAS
jgi:PHD/YefM family antitoxin component YafN of YafNO toxin-antitoxin module